MSPVGEKLLIPSAPCRANGGMGLLDCAKSAQQSANSRHDEQTRCQAAVHRCGMAKIIPVQFRKSRLPRRLLNDGWWLESKPVRPSIIVFPKAITRKQEPNSKSNSEGKIPHLTLVTSGQ
jgi:hypothetical protein